MASDTSIEIAQEIEQDVNTEDSSTSEAMDDNTPADSSAAEDVDGNNTSDSSSGEGDKDDGPQSLEEMIGKSIDEVTKEQAEDSPSEETSDQDQNEDDSSETENKEQEDAKAEDETGDDTSEDEASEEEKSASDEWRNNPATKKVLAERKKARAERDEFKQKLEQSEQEASQFRQIKDYLDEGGVSNQDAATALQMVRLWYENPQAMFQELGRMYGELGTQLGAILPTDLQAEVDQGLISPERAKELAQARGQVQASNQKVEQMTEQNKANSAESETQYRVQLFENWANQVSQTDADLNKKLPLITAKMSHYLATEGDPGSPQAAWDRLNRAHQEVTAEIKGFVPKPKSTPKTPQSTGPKVATVSAPNTFEEAMAQSIDNVLASTGGG